MHKISPFPRSIAILLAIVWMGQSNVKAGDLSVPPISYETTPPQNPISKLQAAIDSGKVKLTHDDEHGYLKSTLATLKIRESSQVLVFSKTSLQRNRITPKTPRAIYFNDEISIGFCMRGDVLEVATSDPLLGIVFYTLDQNPAKPLAFTRHTESCLICHGSSANQGFPGKLFRSVSSDRHGELVLSRGTKRIDHTTPIEDRWGGWYVTGTTGKQTHVGNQLVGGWPGKDEEVDNTNVTNLKPYFTVGNYLTPHSDLVALMVLEHQGEGHNRIVRANFLTRMALFEQAEINKAMGVNERSENITKRIHWSCEPLVEYLLFSKEAALKEPIAGTSAFAKEFAAQGPFDSKGRSLREFDLKTRMFRYPMSYLIYTSAFDNIPGEAKDRIYQRLWDVLTGKDQSAEFKHLSQDVRQAIKEILIETKTGLPAYWKK